MLFLQLLFIKAGVSQVAVNNSTGANGSYPTLKSAFDQINLFSQAGNNIAITVSASTVETSSAVLNESSSPWASLKIIPSANITISGTISGPLINLNGADKVVIDGINGANTLTLNNGSTANTASTIRFINDASQNKVTNCIIRGSSTGDNNSTTYGGVVWIYTGTAAGNDYDTISNCDIGPSGSNLPFMAVRGYGTTGKENDGIVISDNTIHDFFCSTSTTGTEGVYVGLYNNGWTINGNKFYQSATRTYTTTASEFRAIYINNTTTPGGGYTIDGNIIGYSSSSATGTTTITGSSNMIRGIYIKTPPSAAQSNISNNTITAISQTTTRNGTTSTIASSPFIAIAVDVSGTVSISNNLVGSASGMGSIVVNHNYNSGGSTMPVTGIFISGNAAHTVSENTIGAITLNKASVLESLSFNGIGAEGSGAFSILNNIIGNSTAGNISSNFTAGLLTGISLNTSSAAVITDGNTISNFSHTGNNSGQIVGIDLSSPTGMVTISNNTISKLIYSGNSGGYVVIGIQTSSFSGAIYHITGNRITGLRNTYTGPFVYSYIHGMYFGHTGTTGHTITSNEIYDLTIAEDGYVIAILMSDAGYTLTNNMISVGLGLPANASIGCYGIYFLAYSYPGYFYYNTVLLGGNSTVGGNYNLAMNLCCVNINSKLINNILINDRTTPSPDNDQAIFIGASGPLTNLTMDHNNLYVNPAIPYVVKKWPDGYATLNAWKAAYNKDQNSISSPLSFVDPQFDLHATASDCYIISEHGIPLPGITTDIDTDPRDPVNPDIGADECIILLPIELISFKAEVIQPSMVLVSWTTASEINNDYFEVERSHDGETFEAIGRIPGSLFSSSQKEYQFQDAHPFSGISYYRLKQVDVDASVTYSHLAAVEILTEQFIRFYPNPVNDDLTVSSTLFQNGETISVALYDITGRLVLTNLIQTREAVLNMESLSPGLYYLSATCGSYNVISRLVKQ